MATSKMVSAIFLFFPFVLALCSAEGRVPVIAWSNTDSMSGLSGVPAGHTVTLSGLQSHYLNHFVDRPQTIVVLMQDKLSMEDFTLYGDVYSEDQSQNAFKNLKESLDNSASHVTLPAVDIAEDEDTLIKYLVSHINGEVAYLQSPDELKEKQLDNSKTNLIILHITSKEVDEGKSKKERLSENDKILGQVSDLFKSQQDSYTIMLTASEPHKEVTMDILNRVRREETQDVVEAQASADNATFIFMNTSCILLFAKEMRLVLNDTDKDFHTHIELVDIFVTADAICSEENRTLTATFKQPDTDGESLDLTMEMYFDNDGYMWRADAFQITYQYSYKNASETYSISSEDKQKYEYILAPLGKSYHCDNPADGAVGNATGTIEFVKLQVQPYNITSNGFSKADDCIGFFTAQLWMVLMTVLLLLLILTFGLTFLLNLSSMDRFDDPKGKQLMITTDD